MARFAVIDVGTNSVKLHVAERGPDGSWTPLADRGEVTRLGEGVRSRQDRFSAAAMQRTLSAVTALVAAARESGAEAMVGVGTMALRTAANAADFVREAELQTGLQIEVITGAEETRLGYLAAASGLDLGGSPVLVFDTGGGSTQFTWGDHHTIQRQFSIDLGAVRLTEAHRLDGVVAAAEIERVCGLVLPELSGLDGLGCPDRLVGMGGGVTTLASVRFGMEVYDASRIHGSRLTRGEVERQLELYRTRDVERRRQIPGLQPQRAGVILAGACIVRVIMQQARAEFVTVSDRGLRHGVWLDRFGR